MFSVMCNLCVLHSCQYLFPERSGIARALHGFSLSFYLNFSSFLIYRNVEQEKTDFAASVLQTKF